MKRLSPHLTPPHRSKNWGFTVVEITIVVVAIAILATIVVVSYRGIRSQTTEASVKSDAQQVGAALGTYLWANNAYPENCDDADFSLSGGNSLDCFVYSNGTKPGFTD